MIGKKKFALLLELLICGLVSAQDFHFSGFMQNMVYVNPGYVAMPPSGEIGLTYRNQWPGIPATFVTYGASFVMPVRSLSSGLGICMMNDIQADGVISRTSAGLQYGYLITLNRDWQVGAGISASWVMKRFNGDGLVYRSELLNELGYGFGAVNYGNYTKGYPDFSVGFIARSQNSLSFGISAGHITRPYDNEGSVAGTRLPVKYAAFISSRFEGNAKRNDLYIEPSAFYSFQDGNQELIWGTRVELASKFLLGAWLRQNLQFRFDAVILSAGIAWEKYNIHYSYDVNLKKINYLSTKMAAHEVTFLYRFEYKEVHKVKRFKKSECPAY